jgi:hypothetical protein
MPEMGDVEDGFLPNLCHGSINHWQTLLVISESRCRRQGREWRIGRSCRKLIGLFPRGDLGSTLLGKRREP